MFVPATPFQWLARPAAEPREPVEAARDLCRKSIVRWIIATVLALCGVHAGAQGNVLISQAEQGAVTLSTCSNAAEAFCSLTYRNVQYINATDHGRLLQSAASFDHLGEAFNPTEGGLTLRRRHEPQRQEQTA